MTSYNLFYHENYNKIKEQFPLLNHQERMYKMSLLWKKYKKEKYKKYRAPVIDSEEE
jgi:hypothetical protein